MQRNHTNIRTCDQPRITAPVVAQKSVFILGLKRQTQSLLPLTIHPTILGPSQFNVEVPEFTKVTHKMKKKRTQYFLKRKANNSRCPISPVPNVKQNKMIPLKTKPNWPDVPVSQFVPCSFSGEPQASSFETALSGSRRTLEVHESRPLGCLQLFGVVTSTRNPPCALVLLALPRSLNPASGVSPGGSGFHSRSAAPEDQVIQSFVTVDCLLKLWLCPCPIKRLTKTDGTQLVVTFLSMAGFPRYGPL